MKLTKVFYLLAVDGLTIAFDNNKELRKEFKVKKKTLKYTQPSQAIFRFNGSAKRIYA